MVDLLTGLRTPTWIKNNWNMFMSEINEYKLSIFYDIDTLVCINDQFGFELGDNEICRISSILKNTDDIQSKVFRIGGDEFIQFINVSIDFQKYIQNIMNKICNREILISVNYSNIKYLSASAAIRKTSEWQSFFDLEKYCIDSYNYIVKEKNPIFNRQYWKQNVIYIEPGIIT